ncbi:MAG: aminoglycoside 6-adenylyltransferase [Anaerolineae bacterium]
MHERYVDLSAQITAWAEAEPDIQGVIVIGSQGRAEPPPDRWSDLDLMVFAATPDRWLAAGRSSANPSAVLSANWLEQFGQPLAVFTEVTPLGGHDWDWCVRRVLYADGRDVDFSILRADRVDEVLKMNAGILSWGCRLLYDSTEQLEQALQATVAAVTAETWGASGGVGISDSALQEAVQVLLYHVVWAQKKVARGEVWTAAGCLNSFMRPYLLTLVEAYSQASGAPAMSFSYEGRFLERRTAPEVLALLQGCAAPCDGPSLNASLGRVLDLIGVLAPVVYAKRGLAWDQAACDGIRRVYREMASTG